MWESERDFDRQDGLTYPFDLEYAAGDVPAFTRGSTLPFRVRWRHI